MMNRRAFSLLGAAILTVVLGARPAAAQAVLQRCNKPIADAENMAKRVSECRRELTAVSRTLGEAAMARAKSPTPPAMTEVVVSSGIPTNLAAATMSEPKLLERLTEYYSILAFDAGNPAPCAQMAHVSYEKWCRVAYGDLVFMRARVGPPAEFLGACRQEAVADSLLVKRESIGAFCSLVAQSKEGPAVLCPKLTRYYRDPPPPGACELFLAEPGRAGACRGLSGEDADLCQHGVLFARAFQARDIALCGASDRCRVLMGGGKQVAQKIAAALKSPAAQWFLKGGGGPVTMQVPAAAVPPVSVPTPEGPTAAQKALNFQGFVCAEPMRSSENRKAAMAAVGAGQLCLKDVEAALSQADIATIKGIDAGTEKLARLQLQFNAAFDAPQAAPKAPSKLTK